MLVIILIKIKLKILPSAKPALQAAQLAHLLLNALDVLLAIISQLLTILAQSAQILAVTALIALVQIQINAAHLTVILALMPIHASLAS